MKRKFNTIKKSRKKSKDIDEKIEYLNKECQKTGLNEIMSTSGIYFSSGQEPNPAHTTFGNTSFNGKSLGLTSFSGKSIGGSTNASGHSISPDGQRVAKTYQGVANGFQARPPGYQRTPEHRKVGAFLWYWNGARYDRLEWKYDNQSQGNGGQWAQWKSGMFPYLDPIIGDDSVDPNLLAAIRAAGGGGAAFPDPDDITPPTNPVLFKDDLGDPRFLPVDNMSPEAFDTILDKAKRDKVDKIARTGKYPNASDQKFLQDYLNSISDPARQQSERMRIFKLNGVWFPLASAGSAGEPVSDTEIPGSFAGAQDGDEFAFFGGGNDKPVDPTKKQNKSTTTNIINYINSGGAMGTLPKGWTKQQAKQFYDNYYNGNLSESLNEDVGIGHFEPKVLNVDINKLRKGIMPEFPKDPPEMIDGYSAKSRLAPKKVELPPFIKVTRKDLARNHKLTDKEISDFMNDVKMINDYIKKNPAELIYAMTRYPKDDPRLAQLNFKMDQMKAASDEYVETHFPENQRLFNKLQTKIKQNIELTDPKKFEGHKEAPKFSDVTDVNEQKKKTIAKYFKKPIKKNKNKIQRHINVKEVEKKNIEEISVKKLEVKKIKSKNEILKSAYERQKSDWKEDLKEFTGWQAVAGAGPTNATSQTFGYVDSGFPVSNSETGQQVTTTASGLGGVETLPTSMSINLGFGESMPVNPPTYEQLALAGYAKPILMKRKDSEDVNSKLDASQEFAQKVGADVNMNARVKTDELSLEEKKVEVAKFKKDMREWNEKSTKRAREIDRRIQHEMSKVNKFLSNYGESLPSKISDEIAKAGKGPVRIVEGGKKIIIISHSGFNYDNSKKFNVRVYEAKKDVQGNYEKIYVEKGQFQYSGGSSILNNIYKRSMGGSGTADLMYHNIGEKLEDKNFEIKDIPEIPMPQPPEFMQKSAAYGWFHIMSGDATTVDDEKFISKFEPLAKSTVPIPFGNPLNLTGLSPIPSGGLNLAAKLAVNYAKGDLTPITKSPGSGFDRVVINAIRATMEGGETEDNAPQQKNGQGTNSFFNPKSKGGAVRYDVLISKASDIKKIGYAPVTAALGAFAIKATDKGIQIIDDFDIDADSKNVGAAAILDPLTKFIGGTDVQQTANRLVAIAANRAAELGFDMINQKGQHMASFDSLGNEIEPLFDPETGKEIKAKVETPRDYKIPINYTIPWSQIPPSVKSGMGYGNLLTGRQKQTIQKSSKIVQTSQTKTASKTVQRIKNMSKSKSVGFDRDDVSFRRKKED